MKVYFLTLLAFGFLSLLRSCSSETGLPELKTVDINSISQTSAISGGQIISGGGSSINAKGVCWSFERWPTTEDSHTLDGTGNDNYISTLTELTPGTLYYVRAYASNDEGTSYGDEKDLMTLSFDNMGQIIADHKAVKEFEKIPKYYIDQVKKMRFVIAGESHALGYVKGLQNLEKLASDYDCNYYGQAYSTPEKYTTSHLRCDLKSWGDLVNSSGWIGEYGEEDWFTSPEAINRTKSGLIYANNSEFVPRAYGFGWCYDGGIIDAKEYLAATQAYVDLCAYNHYITSVFFTTGPVDAGYDYNKYLMYKQIRDYVYEDDTRILFDYADILCYDDTGDYSAIPYVITSNGHQIPAATPSNKSPEDYGHISVAGQIRLAKSIWWMLARIAGWDGG